jgi:hypothetical protein
VRTFNALVAAVGLLGGCTSAGESAAIGDGPNDAGFVVVNNSDPAWASEEVWTVSQEPRVSIGAFDGPEHYQLFDVRAAARQSDGEIVLVDGGTRELRLYDRKGVYLRTLGRRGSGPGEFQEPNQLLIAADDSLLVWDDALARITRFDSAGEFIAVQSVDRGKIARAVAPPFFPWFTKLLPGGQLVVELLEKEGKEPRPGISRAQAGALRVSEDILRIDTLLFYEAVEKEAVDVPWGGRFGVEPPMAKTTLIAVQSTSQRVCFGDQAAPEVHCFGPGTTRIAIRWQAESAPIEEYEVNAWREKAIEMYSLKITETEARRLVDQVSVPPDRPYFTRLVLDVLGNLWVEQKPVHWAEPEDIDFLVFDPEGLLLGTATLPPIDALEIGEDYVLGVYRDEMAVEYVRMHSLVKPLATDRAM